MPVLNDTAIKNITVAGSIIYEIFSIVDGMNLKGTTTLALNDRIDEIIREHNAIPTFLNYRGFPKSCCISLNNEVVHGIPDERTIRDGDLVKVDIGVTYKGYIADAARTFPVGKVDPAALALIRVTRQALANGIASAQAGHRIADISRAVQKTAEAGGFSVVRELTGHGVGENLHEEPMIPNYLCEGSSPPIKKGMALAIEPMINAGGYDVVTAANGWTIITKDNSLSCHYEDTIVVLEHGNLNVTRVLEN
ncbi:MAG TPA: type I methionyl aminopeptidase [bacterium]